MGKITERLGNPVFKMSSVTIVDTISEERGREEIFVRPIHEAFLANKVVCPISECVENVLFFEEPGLPQHFRVAHKKHVTPEDMKNSALTMKRCDIFNISLGLDDIVNTVVNNACLAILAPLF